MGQAGDYRPKRQGRRYRALSLDYRRLYYLVRRYLYFTPAEWDALPWWAQKVYIEGLKEELTDHTRADPSEAPDDFAGLGFTMKKS